LGEFLSVKIHDYDALGRLLSVTDALGGITSYTYDEVGNKLTQTDANNHTTSWTYDNGRRTTSRTLPLGQFETFAYDAKGNALTRTDFNGDAITYVYDENNRLISKTYPDLSSVSYTYTLTGQRETVADASGTTSFTYDDRNRLLSQTNPDLTFLNYTYDAAGNRTSVQTPNGTTTYTFDELNRLFTAVDPSANTTSYTYDAVGNRTSVAYPNGTTAYYTYDELNRLTYLENVRSNLTVISSYAYTLGLSGNRTQVVEHDGRTVDYVYDDLYRLTQENILDPTNGNKTFTYAYDAVGNRLTKTEDLATTNYTYDANDRLTTEGSNTYGWDENGNQISKTDGSETTTYVFDYENRLVSATTPTSSISYFYDADSIRKGQDVDGTITNYLVDKNRPYAQVLEETGNLGGLIASYVYGDDLISQDRTGGVSYYHYDGLGSTRALTDELEAATDTYAYEALGTVLASVGNTPNNYLFTGEQFDPNVGFYYLRARWMSPELGRFVSMDSFTGFDHAPASLHKYIYAEARPEDRVDPSGEFATNLCSLMTVVAVLGIESEISVSSFRPLTFKPKAELMFFLNLNRIVLFIYIRDGVVGTQRFEARDDVTKGRTKIASGFTNPDVFPLKIPKQKAYGPGDYTYIDTQHPSGKDIHGGGSGLADPFADYQGWRPTYGCIRMQNADVRSLSKSILAFKNRYPGSKVPFTVK